MPGASVSSAMGAARGFSTAKFTLDEEFEPVHVPGFTATPSPAGLGASARRETSADTYVVRGTVSSTS